MRFGISAALAVLLSLAVVAAPATADAQEDAILKRADQLNDEGKDLFGRGELDEAASKFRAAIALSPQARYYFNLCFVLNARKEYRAALGACHEVRTSPGVDDRLQQRTNQLITAIEKKRKAAGDERPVDPPPRKDPDPPPPKKDPDPPPPKKDPPPPVVDPNAPPPITNPPPRQPPAAGFVGPAAGRVGVEVQPLPPKKIHIGATLGFSAASLAGNDFEFTNARQGFTAGVFVASSFSRRVAGQIELAYVQRGGGADDFDFTFDLSLNYITVPVLAKFLLPLGRMVRFHGDGGFALSFLTTSDSFATRFDGMPDPVLFDQPGVDFSFILGGGITLHRQGRNAWTFDIRYEFGLTDVTPEGLPDMNNRSTSLRAGYAF